MKLGVSAWRLTGQRLGIGRYIEYMLRHWNTMLEPADEVTVFVRDALDLEEMGLSKAFSARVLRPAMKNALWENFLLCEIMEHQSGFRDRGGKFIIPSLRPVSWDEGRRGL